MIAWSAAALAAVSYLAGGIPTGYLIVKRLKGFDIRERGSGNPGTANVYRTAGTLAGAVTLFGDALKGFLPVLVARRMFPDEAAVHIVCGAAAIVGHNWTVFLGFRGGKGVATSAGVFAALTPIPTACALGAFLAAVRLSGHISVGSMTGAVLLPIFDLILGVSPAYTWMSAGSGALILIRHIPNIRHLLGQKELYFAEKK